MRKPATVDKTRMISDFQHLNKEWRVIKIGGLKEKTGDTHVDEGIGLFGIPN